MQQPSRGNKISRRSWLLAGLATPLFSVRAAESLEVKFDGDNLHVSAPSLRFLIGKPLERLKDGASVAYVTQLTLFNDDHVTVVRRRTGRFVVSFALWEEKFSVTQLVAAPGSRLRFELATADQRDLSSMPDERGLSLSALVDFFSRKPKEGEPHWPALERRLRLSDLPRMTGRGRNV